MTSRYKACLLSGIAACAALVGIVPARAQSVGTLNRQVEDLQNQLSTLTKQLQQLQSQVVETQHNQALTNDTVNERMKAAPVAPSSGIVVSIPNNRPTISTADSRNSIALTGRIQWDVGDYLHYHAENSHGTGTPANLNSGENIRRARLGLTGKVAGDWNYALIYDFGGSTDNGPGTPGSTQATASGGIQTAQISYVGIPHLAIEGGVSDTYFTLEEATSSNDIMFIERPSSQVIAANLVAGDFRENAGARWTTDRLWLGAYVTGPSTGTIHGITNGVAQEFGAYQRAAYQILQGDEYSLHLGADASELLKPETAAGARVVTNFSDRPELRIDPTQILNAGTLGSATNPVTGAEVFGAELAGGLGPAFAQAEYFHYAVDRQGLPTASFDGGYVEASYTVTGEHRKYIPAAGAYSGISPTHPFSLATFTNGDWGALELGVRYSAINLKSNYTTGVVTSASSGAVAGGEQQVLTLGANWYVNNNIRFMLDYLHGKITKPVGTQGIAGAPLGSGIGAGFDAIALRTQVAW